MMLDTSLGHITRLYRSVISLGYLLLFKYLGVWWFVVVGRVDSGFGVVGEVVCMIETNSCSICVLPHWLSRPLD